MECGLEKSKVAGNGKNAKIKQPNFAEMLMDWLYDSAEGKAFSQDLWKTETFVWMNFSEK